MFGRAHGILIFKGSETVVDLCCKESGWVGGWVEVGRWPLTRIMHDLEEQD